MSKTVEKGRIPSIEEAEASLLSHDPNGKFNFGFGFGDWYAFSEWVQVHRDVCKRYSSRCVARLAINILKYKYKDGYEHPRMRVTDPCASCISYSPSCRRAVQERHKGLRK